MGKLIKFAIPFVVLGSVATTVGGGNPMNTVTKTTNMVKSMVTSTELSRFGDALYKEHQQNGTLPTVGSEEELAEFISTSFTAAGRDATYDFWDNPYEAVQVSDTQIVLISRGPNGVPDEGCSDDTDDPGVVSDAEAAVPEGGGLNPNDDICVVVDVSEP